jgi:uncharacterized membrane protein
MSEIVWEPILPLPVLAAIVLGGMAAIAWSFWHGFRLKRPVRTLVLTGLRLAALLLLLLLILQPRRRSEEVTVLKPQVAVLVDTSESMTDAIDPDQPSRAERVRAWLKSEAFANVAGKFEVRVFTHDSRLHQEAGKVDPDALEFNGPASSIQNSLLQLADRFKGQPLTAILLLSDGQDSGKPDPEKISWDRGIPIHTFELEKPFQAAEAPRKISLAGVDFPGKIVVGSDIEINLSVMASGLSGQTVPLQLLKDGEVLKETTVAFNQENQSRDASFSIPAKEAGPLQLELKVAHPSADDDAKSRPVIIQVMEPGRRILYVQNSLSPGFKFLRRALTSDDTLNLDSFVRWANGNIVAIGGTATFGGFSTAGLTPYSIVIIGDLAAGALTAEEFTALGDFVNRGGGLVVMGGPESLPKPEFAASALGRIMPVTLPAPYHEQELPVQITDDGLRHPVLGPLFEEVASFPPLISFNQAAMNGTTSTTLIEARTQSGTLPIIAAARHGEGRIVAIMTNTLWRWHLAATQKTRGKNPHDLFWTQLVEWLVPDFKARDAVDTIDLFTERTTYLLGERPEMQGIIRASVPADQLPATLALTVETPDKKTFEYQMARSALRDQAAGPAEGYKIGIEPHIPGVYVARSKIALNGKSIEGEARFIVNKPATEKNGEPIHRALLEKLAAVSGGTFFPNDQTDQWPDKLAYQEKHFTRLIIVDLWNHPLILSVLLVTLSAEWFVRRTNQLP